MRVAHRIGHHEFLELAVGGFGALRQPGCGLAQPRDDRLGHRLPDGTVTGTLQVVEAIVDRLMRQAAQRLPVGRVERFFDGGIVHRLGSALAERRVRPGAAYYEPSPAPAGGRRQVSVTLP